MKRIVKSSILFALIDSVLLTCTSCAVGKYNLQRYFDEWESEVDIKVYPTYDFAILRLENELFDVRDYVIGDISEVYCIYENRIPLIHIPVWLWVWMIVVADFGPNHL